jgi:phage shock protein PspC (stress-responsive transcriptional regulator)/tetrahydromethanopterin S-methyltransferase subunit G
MNKTVNINLGGIFFHIDEDAYQKLTKYFDAIKRSLTNASGQEEILNDIEMRVSELLTERQKTEKHVVTTKEVDEVIAIMGQPEDYRIDNPEETQKTANFNSNKNATHLKKLYRDKENATVGGVLAGLGHYFGVEKVWLRLAALILLLCFGTGVLLYFILWIAIPEAKTTAEKLEMTGEPVNISNIERKVREEFDNVSDKLKSADYDKMGNHFKNSAEKVGNTLGEIIETIMKAFSKVIGVLIILSGLSTLILLLIGIFALGSNVFIDFPWSNFIESGNYSDYPAWTFGLVMFFAVGIPFFFFTVLGFKLLSPTIKSISRTVSYTLLAIWIIAVTLAISIGIQQAMAFSEDGREIEKKYLTLQPTDTLNIKFVNNEKYSGDLNEKFSFRFIEDSLKNKVIYSTDVAIQIETTDEKQAYIKIEKQARGKSIAEANNRAKQIQYKYQIIGNQLVFDNYLTTAFKNKFRGQEVEITLYLPKGTVFKCDKSLSNYDESDNEAFNLHLSGNYTYKVMEEKIKCLNCPADEDEYNDDIDTEDINLINENDSIKTVSVKINGKEVIQTKTGKSNNSLEINKDGIIIKTK